MNASDYRVRRATLEDIGPLTALWQSMHFPADSLSKRVTEFQVAQGPDGQLIGAVGLQIAEKQGRIHSEGFNDFAVADQLRPLLWDRLRAVANNHGLLRLWTREQAPFWNHCGLAPADGETLGILPAAWREQSTGWRTLKLREDLETITSLDHELKMFMEAEKQRTARAFQQAKVLKAVATLIAFAVLVLVLAGAFIILKRNPHALGR
jgi:N-acetylglutamate synthase-like GNAT family acetyltransferase